MIVTDTDELGRKTNYIVPDGAPKSTWSQGILMGPPDLSELGLPEEVAIKLHNELFNRGLVSKRDIRQRRQDIMMSFAAAMRFEVERIIQLYEETGNA
jgi:hypothetical protein